MERKDYRTSDISVGMGGSLIVVILVVLCLTVFSVLSFSTAYSDLKLTEKAEEMTYDYYKINGKAEEKLSDIYTVLISVNGNLKEAGTAEAFFNNAKIKLTEIYGVSVSETNNGTLKAYYESLGDKNQKICVTLNIMYDEINHSSCCTIETWNLSPIELPDYEQQNIDLWEGFE